MDSLVLGDIELLGGGPASTNPSCAGAIFRLLDGFDLSAPQPDTDFVASLLLDGELQVGRRSSNRKIVLPVWIIAPDRDTLAAAREHLEQTIDQDSYTLTWTRDRAGGAPLPLIFDCQRAGQTVPVYSIKAERQLAQKLTVTLPALPFGRSDQQERLQFAAPVPSGPPAPPSPVVLDNYSTITSPFCSQSTKCVVGPNSCCYDPDSNLVNDPQGLNTSFTYNSTLTAAVDLTNQRSISMYLGFGSRYYWCLDYHGKHGGVRVEVTLTDNDGTTISMSRGHLKLPVTPTPQTPCFTPVSMRIPQGVTAFNYAAVVKYTLKVTNHHYLSADTLRNVVLYVDALTAYPDSQTAAPVTRGNVYMLYGLKGTARSALSASFTQPPSAGTPTTITAAGAGTYTVPALTNWIKVEAVGGGGAGGSRSTTGVAGGGGGAEYAREDVFPCAPGDVIPYIVGAAGASGASPTDGGQTQFGPGPASSMILTANGGHSVAQNSTTGGLPGDGSTNSVHYKGGAGRTASGSVGGGGGSSGGSSSIGGTPLGAGSGSFTATGTTVWVCPAGVTQVYAEAWGSGGGGATGNGSQQGAAGGGGEYAAGFVNVTPGNSYNVVVATGGAGASGGTLRNGNDGGSSTFTGDAGAQVIAHGGTHGSFGYSGGSGLGGSGSSNPVHYNGGLGGWANPYGGGGGSSASPSGPGNQGDGNGNAGAAPTDGGAGGAGTGPTTNAGHNGSQPGGGGSGTYNNATAGNGAAGKVRLTYPGGAPDQFGAAAVTGGGAGGNGGASGNTVGSAGSQPGGGGGGANSAGTAEVGGAGGVGKITITPYAPQAFKSLLVHRPPRGTSKYFQPLVSVGAGADVPNGSTWYTMPQPVTGVNALFGGTYTVYLANSSFNGSGTRTVTVTFRQTEYAGGPTYTTATIPVAFTPSQITNGLLCAGVVNLPVKLIPPDNSQASFAVSVTDTNTADRWLDCIVLDTMGQTMLINEPSTGYATYLLDAPDPNKSLGLIMGTQSDRTAAVSVMGEMTPYSGGPLAIEPADGQNILFAYCAGALAPAIGVSYFARWFFDRTS